MLFSNSQFDVHFFIVESPNVTWAMKGSVSGHASEHVILFTTNGLEVSLQEETHSVSPSDLIKPLIHLFKHILFYLI